MRQPGPRVSLRRPCLSLLPSPSLFLAALSVSLRSLSYSCLLFNGARRCSLIDGTGHGRTGGAEEGKRKPKGERKGIETDEERKRWEGRVGGGQPLDHHRLIYNAGDNRIHDQNPAFRGIDGSPCAARRRDDSGIFK